MSGDRAALISMIPEQVVSSPIPIAGWPNQNPPQTTPHAKPRPPTPPMANVHARMGEQHGFQR